jgi:hypothetical protein
MYVIFQGESLLIPATVTGSKQLINNLAVVIKRSNRGEVPLESEPVAGTFTVAPYTSPEVTDGYLFTLANTSALTPGIYYVNYEYTISGNTFKGVPKRVTVKESVI